MLSAQDRLALGLWALDFVETASKGPWRRFAKFGRAGMEGEAYYVMAGRWRLANSLNAAAPDELWHSPIRITEPVNFVGSATNVLSGPIFEQIWQAGYRAYQLNSMSEAMDAADTLQRRKSKIDPDAALDELIGGSNGNE